MQRRLRLTPIQASVLSAILGRFADNEGDKIKMMDDSSMGSFMINEAEKIADDLDAYVMNYTGFKSWEDFKHINDQYLTEDIGDFPIELVVDLYHLNGEKESLKEVLLPHAIKSALNALLTASNRYESLVGGEDWPEDKSDQDLVREEKEINQAIKLIAGVQ